jgi:transposase-like protein
MLKIFGGENVARYTNIECPDCGCRDITIDDIVRGITIFVCENCGCIWDDSEDKDFMPSGKYKPKLSDW